MKTSEIVRHVAADILDDRKNLISGESDQLFPDSLICMHLTEAQRVLARRAWVLEDVAKSCASRIRLVEDKTDYTLDKSVLFVKSAKLSDSDVDLIRVGYDDNRVLPAKTAAEINDYWDVNSAYIETSGRPSRFSTDAGMRMIRFRKKPDAASALLRVDLTVVRMPLESISMATPDAEPEVPEEFHMAMAKYAAGMCLQRPKVEAELRSLGRGMVKEFDAAVLEAKRDRQRLQQSMPMTRFGSTVKAP